MLLMGGISTSWGGIYNCLGHQHAHGRDLQADRKTNHRAQDLLEYAENSFGFQCDVLTFAVIQLPTRSALC